MRLTFTGEKTTLPERRILPAITGTFYTSLCFRLLQLFCNHCRDNFILTSKLTRSCSNVPHLGSVASHLYDAGSIKCDDRIQDASLKGKNIPPTEKSAPSLPVIAHKPKATLPDRRCAIQSSLSAYTASVKRGEQIARNTRSVKPVLVIRWCASGGINTTSPALT